MIWYRFCIGKPHRMSTLFLCKKYSSHCTVHSSSHIFRGVSSSIPKLEHGGEVASVAAAASRKKKRLVGLWKVASECRGSLLRSTIRLLVDGGCNAEAAVKHTGTTSRKIFVNILKLAGEKSVKKLLEDFSTISSEYEIFCFATARRVFCFVDILLNYWAFKSSKLFRFLLIWAYYNSNSI